jgi:phosphatidylserine decarboxylase
VEGWKDQEVRLISARSTLTTETDSLSQTQVKRLLESMTIKQGMKFESSASVSEISPFIRFHNLDMDEVLNPITSFKNFNEFFYRKLKPTARPVVEDPNVVVSPADVSLYSLSRSVA